jgi:hypothetical protein
LKKIKIHRFENEKWGRAHLPFYRRFDKYLEKHFDVETINYNTDGKTFSGRIDTISNISTFAKNPPLSDAEYVIENQETGELKVLSIAKYFNSHVSHYAKSECCSTVLFAHFSWRNIYYWLKKDKSVISLPKVKPWIFFPYAEFDIQKYRDIRNNEANFIEKLFFKGGGLKSYRKVVSILDGMGYTQPLSVSAHSEYLTLLAKSKIAMSFYMSLDKYVTPFEHQGEYCYRDIEYLSLGVPFIRIEFKSSMYDDLIPNHHYITIPREEAYLAYDKEGDLGVAKLYADKYDEVINDIDFLNYISTNQIDWADRNLIYDQREHITYKLLELDKWK